MNFYRLLGVSPDATPDQIKKAFYRRAKKFHPDVSPGSAEIFKLINKAYQTLVDPQQKMFYDRLLSRKNLLEIFQDKLAEFLGFTDKPVKGKTIRINLPVSIQEGINSAQKELRYKRKVICERCDGLGFTEKSRIVQCDRCETGKITTPFGRFICPKCLGKGFVVENPCEVCHGKGLVIKQEIVVINVPVGVENGEVLTFKKLGDAGVNGGDYGDLKVVFSLDTGVYQKDGKNLVLKLKLPDSPEKYSQLSIKVPTGEKVCVALPQEKPPVKLRLKEHGYTDRDGNRGDLIIYLL